MADPPTTPIPRIGVAVIVVKSDQVLLGKRKGAHGEGTWAFPGGHLQFGESIEACARREVMEETGLRIDSLTPGPYTNDIFQQDNKHYITLFVVARHAGGKVQNKEPHKCFGWQWFDWDSLPSPRFLSLENLCMLAFNPISHLALRGPG